MRAADYDFLSSFLMQSSGLALGSGKEYLIESRLSPLSQSMGYRDFDQLLFELRRGENKQLSQAVTEAMTTNETLFFRDKTPFEDLKLRLLPPIIESRANERRLRIWSAACSTGQEPYSLAILLKESFPILANWQVDIIATDIAQSILDRAQEAVYSQFEVQRGLPIQYLVKYFDQHPRGWQVKESLRKMVRFQKLNLLENFAGIGTLDLILCRNVLIYFDAPTKKQILDRMHGMLRPQGYLMLGAAESVLGICERFSRFRECTSAVYLPS